MRYIIILLSLILIIFFTLSIQTKNVEIKPVNLNKNHMCASDAMIIVNYNGPKAQILWKDGSRSFYCEAREIFYDLLDTIKNKQVLASYVQDFSNIEWGSYNDRWILAKDAYYVVDSDKDGAMGLTYFPFSILESAKLFQSNHGGDLLKFNEITAHTLSKSANLLKDRMIF